MFYLGATASEMANSQVFSAKTAYMACHFSQSSPGLSNIPRKLPPGSLLLLDDQNPPAEHDPAQVLQTLSKAAAALQCAGVYLDFQRQGYPLLAEIAARAKDLPCPVAVSQLYSGENRLPVVLSPTPPEVSVEAHLAPWKGREIWLEVALSRKKLTLTAQGCQEGPWEHAPAQGFREERLCCHYAIQAQKNAAIFHLWRTFEDLQALMTRAKNLGVTHTLGLYQELASYL